LASAGFALGRIWQQSTVAKGSAVVTGDRNELVAPIHPKAMITVLASEDQEGRLIRHCGGVVKLE
jgi:putative SOS response-associated peptidase YedK